MHVKTPLNYLAFLLPCLVILHLTLIYRHDFPPLCHFPFFVPLRVTFRRSKIRSFTNGNHQPTDPHYLSNTKVMILENHMGMFGF